MSIHKETFFQPANDGIPSHYVVQYYINDEGEHPRAKYFSTLAEAYDFEKKLDGNCERDLK